MPTRTLIVAAGRRYLGTPYHHQGALAGAGCDCLGLVRGIWRDLYGTEPEIPPPYTPDWGEVGGAEPLLEAARRYLVPLVIEAARPGDLLLFRLRPHTAAKHIALLTSPTTMLHAQSGDQVRDVVLTASWLKRRTAAFSFPGLED